MEYITLNNGIKIPQLGLGTYLLKPDDAQSSVTSALGMGYELIDTANAYVNERAVGRGVRESDLPRENVYLETKLWPYFYNSDTAVDETLERLNTPYIDLMILHQPAGDYLAGYEKLEIAYKEGKLRSIGISNFDENEIEKLLANCEIVPSLIQVECHPYFPQTELKKLLAQHDIALQAWYPSAGAVTAASWTSPSCETSLPSMAKRLLKSLCAGISKREISSFQAPRIRRTSPTTSMSSTSSSQIAT